MWDLILGVGTSILTGGATGLLGTSLSMLGDHFKRQQDLEMKRLDNAHEMEVMKFEWGSRERIAITEADAAMDVQDGKTFAASYNMEPKRYAPLKGMNPVIKFLLGIVDFWRGLIRPAMTTYLVVIVTMMYWQFLGFMEQEGVVLKETFIVQIVTHIVYSIVYLAMTCTLWWFGTRNKNQPPSIIK